MVSKCRSLDKYLESRNIFKKRKGHCLMVCQTEVHFMDILSMMVFGIITKNSCQVHQGLLRR